MKNRLVKQHEELKAEVRNIVSPALNSLQNDEGMTIPCKLRLKVEDRIVREVATLLQQHINQRD